MALYKFSGIMFYTHERNGKRRELFEKGHLALIFGGALKAFLFLTDGQDGDGENLEPRKDWEHYWQTKHRKLVLRSFYWALFAERRLSHDIVDGEPGNALNEHPGARRL